METEPNRERRRGPIVEAEKPQVPSTICPTCLRDFKSEHALKVHVSRAHK